MGRSKIHPPTDETIEDRPQVDRRSRPPRPTAQDPHPAREPSGQNSESPGRAAFTFTEIGSTPEPTRDASGVRDRSMIPMVFVRHGWLVIRGFESRRASSTPTHSGRMRPELALRDEGIRW
jgi:hypothetical protein